MIPLPRRPLTTLDRLLFAALAAVVLLAAFVGHDAPGVSKATAAEPEAPAAGAANAACLVAYTSQGSTAQRMSRERPLQPVLALTPYLAAARRLALVWGLETRIAGNPADLDDMTNRAVRAVLDNGLAGPGRAVLIVAGVPFGTPGATNLFRLAYTPRR